jgi:hypothetical protein
MRPVEVLPPHGNQSFVEGLLHRRIALLILALM